MIMISAQFLFAIFFITTVSLHIGKKIFGAAMAYSVQSFVIVLLIAGSFVQTGSIALLFVALLVLVTKVILTPILITRAMKKSGLKFLMDTYVNIPMTLVIIAVITAVAHSSLFAPLVSIIPANKELLSLSLSTILISFFLIVNHKGAISQIIGVLSLENSIVAFVFFAGLEQSLSLQIGIMFDIVIWIIIATVFASMIYRHFGSLDVTEMEHLKD